MIEVDVEFSRGDFSLQVQFESGAGLTGLFGPSGSGKTTLIHLIAGLLQPTRGRIAIGGETLFDSTRNIELPARLRRVGLVYQDALLFPHLSARERAGTRRLVRDDDAQRRQGLRTEGSEHDRQRAAAVAAWNQHIDPGHAHGRAFPRCAPVGCW